jgi:hypothetical protein
LDRKMTSKIHFNESPVLTNKVCMGLANLVIWVYFLCWFIECAQADNLISSLITELHDCYIYPLFYSSQRLHELGDEFKSLPLWRQVCYLFYRNLESSHDSPSHIFPIDSSSRLLSIFCIAALTHFIQDSKLFISIVWFWYLLR